MRFRFSLPFLSIICFVTQTITPHDQCYGEVARNHTCYCVDITQDFHNYLKINNIKFLGCLRKEKLPEKLANSKLQSGVSYSFEGDFYIYCIEPFREEVSLSEELTYLQGKSLQVEADFSRNEVENTNSVETLTHDSETQFENPGIKVMESRGSFASISANLGLDLGVNAYQVVLDPRHKTGLYAEVNFPVKKIWKKLGDRFEKGETLIQLENTVPLGNYDKAVAQKEQAVTKFEAVNQLFKENLSSFFELKEAETEIAKSKAELIIAEKNLYSTHIIAPYSGIIDTIYIEEHELPSNGKELMKIIDDEVLIARFLVPSRLFPIIRVGLPFTIHISETGQEIEVKVSRIGGMIDAVSSTMKIEAELDNHERKFKAGMSGIAIIKSSEVHQQSNEEEKG